MNRVSKYFFTVYLHLIIQVEDAPLLEKFPIRNHEDTEKTPKFSVTPCLCG
jgi:hypothetical protein